MRGQPDQPSRVPAPTDPRAHPIAALGRVIPLVEADDEAIADLRLLRKLERKDRDGQDH